MKYYLGVTSTGFIEYFPVSKKGIYEEARPGHLYKLAMAWSSSKDPSVLPKPLYSEVVIYQGGNKFKIIGYMKDGILYLSREEENE